MVTVQLYDTGELLEAKDAKITFIKTTGDLGQLTSVNSSYSWSMKFPKSPQNTQILGGLGLVGSGSRKPYEKVYCNLLDNGFPITIKGLLNIKETKEEYGIFIQEGFIDFLKDITNETIGESLDLSPLDHTRDYATILNSFDLALPYAYLVSDVNGGYLLNEANTTNLDPNYMAPYANVGYLWDLIFSTYGWTFDINSTVRDSIDGTWMSYPSEIIFGDEDATQAAQLGASNTNAIQLGTGSLRIFHGIVFNSIVTNNDYIIPQTSNGRQFVIQENGNYKLTYDSKGRSVNTDYYGNVTYGTYDLGLFLNGELFGLSLGGSSDMSETKTLYLPLNEGDVIELVARTINFDVTTSVEVEDAFFNIFYLVQGEVSFTQALIKYKLSDFIKEVMTREALTPFVDSINNHIQFLTLDERLRYEFVDWSHMYSKRLSESYLYRDYAQANYLRHKYDDDGEDFNDGILDIDNANLDTEKTIYTSRSFSPSRQLSTFTDSGEDYKVPRLAMYDAEVKEEEGVINIKYKFLKDRFFFVKAVQSSRDIYIDTNLVDGYPMVNTVGAVFRDIINSRYSNFKRISNDAKVHQIELAVPLVDVVTLDLRKIVYFEQEASFYILNRLTYKTGEMSRAEFLKIEPELVLGNGAFSNAFNNSFSI